MTGALRLAGLSFEFDETPVPPPPAYREFWGHPAAAAAQHHSLSAAARSSLREGRQLDRIPVSLEILPELPEHRPAADFIGGELWSWSGRRGRSDYRMVSYDIAPEERPVPVQLASLAARGRKLLVQQRPEAGFPLDYIMGHLVTTEVLAYHQGVLLHACGVIDRGRGLLFAGQSGIGKTTTARLWLKAGATVLNDDRVALRLIAGLPRIYGTPWPGELQISSPREAPLRGLYLLRQGRENTLRELPPAEAAARLTRASFSPFWKKEAMELVFETLGKTLEKVPAFEFAFRKSPSAVSFIRDHLR